MSEHKYVRIHGREQWCDAHDSAYPCPVPTDGFNFGLPEWLTGATPDTGRTDEFGMSWEQLADHAYAYATGQSGIYSDEADLYGMAFANYWYGYSDSADHTKDVSRAMLAEAVKRCSGEEESE